MLWSAGTCKDEQACNILGCHGSINEAFDEEVAKGIHKGEESGLVEGPIAKVECTKNT